VAGACGFRSRHPFLKVTRDDRAQSLSGVTEADRGYCPNRATAAASATARPADAADTIQ